MKDFICSCGEGYYRCIRPVPAATLLLIFLFDFVVQMSRRLCLLVVVAALSAVMSNLQMVATGTSIGETIQGFLVPQNEARRQVGVPPLKWDVKLTNYARSYHLCKGKKG